MGTLIKFRANPIPAEPRLSANSCASQGILRGRLAIPIHDRTGELVADCGRVVNGESLALIFPNGFQPTEHILGAHLVKPGPLHVLSLTFIWPRSLQNRCREWWPCQTDGMKRSSMVGIAARHDLAVVTAYYTVKPQELWRKGEISG